MSAGNGKHLISRAAAVGIPAFIFLVALALRLLHLHEIQKDILYHYPVLDEELYYRAAKALAAGEHLPLPHWRPPGLTYALALLIRVFGEGPLALRVGQALLSAGSCLLVYVLARRFLSRTQALAAAAILAFHGVVIDAAGELKSATWELFLNLLGLLLLVDASRRRSTWLALAAGAVFGVSALFRPIILAFVPVALVWLSRGVPGKKEWVLMGATALGLALPMAPVVYQNNKATGIPVLVSTNGGVNFFIGNNPDYRRTLTARPGNQWNQYILGPAWAAGFPTDGPEQDRFYYQTAFAFIREHPGRAFLLELRKFYLFFHGREIPRDTEIYSTRESSRVVWTLVGPSWPYFPNGYLIPLALVGIVVGRRRREVGLLISFLAVQALLFAAYFPASRYRVPSIPFLCILGVIGAGWGLEFVRRGSWPRRILAAAIALGALSVLNVSTFETRQDLRAERLYFRGNALVLAGRHREAFDTYVQAVQLDSTDARPLLGMEAIYSKDRRWAEATRAIRRAIAIGPYSARDRDRLLQLLVTQRDYEGAILELRKDIDINKDLPQRGATLRFSLGSVYYRKHDYDRSLEAFREAAATDTTVFKERLLPWAGPLLQSEKLEPGEGPGRGLFWFQLGRDLGRLQGPRYSILMVRHAADLLFENPSARKEVDQYLQDQRKSRISSTAP